MSSPNIYFFSFKLLFVISNCSDEYVLPALPGNNTSPVHHLPSTKKQLDPKVCPGTVIDLIESSPK